MTMGQIYGWLASSGSGSSVAKTGDTMTGKLQYSGTNHAGIRLNNLTTTQQNALTGAAGDTVWNSTLAAIGVYDGSVWQQQAVLGLAQTFTAAQTIKKDAIGTTSTDGFLLRNTTAAAAGAQQYSPRSVWEGQGWKTNATAASQAVAFMAEVRPVQGAANPTGTLALAASINGGAYADRFTLSSDGAAVFNTVSGFSGTVADLQVNGTSYFNVSTSILWSRQDFSQSSGGFIGWSNSNSTGGTVDLKLNRDTANTLGLRNAGTAGSPVPQTMNFTEFQASSSDYSRFAIKAGTTGSVHRLSSEAANTGTVRAIVLDYFNKGSALAAGDLPAGTWGVMYDGTSAYVVANIGGSLKKSVALV